MTKNHKATNLFSYVGKNNGIMNERSDDIGINNCDLRDGNIHDSRIQLNKGNIIRINPAKKIESNEGREINDIIDEEDE